MTVLQGGSKKFFLVGGAGFIGSHFVDALLQDLEGSQVAGQVTVYDNFSSGREWHYQQHSNHLRFKVIRGDAKDLPFLTDCMVGHSDVIHLASNPDIARAAVEPDIDFREGTVLTQNVLEAMRRSKTRRILYASGSGVYGDLAETEAMEDFGPKTPVSTYGASKLAGEVLISSYCSMFGMVGRAFRFGNVVGPRQTHGVGFDFVRRLLTDCSCLRILGDGKQSKSYIHVKDIVSAVRLADQVAGENPQKPFEVYNVATGDYITVREIADLALECLDLKPSQVAYQFTGGDRGWKGDIPIVRLNTDRIQKLGWTCKRSTREALKESLLALIAEARKGRL